MRLAIGNESAALKDLRKAAELDSAEPAYQEALGFATLQLGQYRAAVQAFEQALLKDETSAPALMGRGSALLELRQLDEAARDLTAAIKLDPDHAYPYKYRGCVYLDQDNVEAALADLTHALQIDAFDTFARRTRGQVHYRMGKFDEAVNDFDFCIDHDNSDVGAYNGRGIAWFAIGKLEAAVADYRSAIDLTEMHTEHAHLWSNLAQALIELGEFQEGLSNMESAIQLDPNFAEVYSHRAWLRSTCPNVNFRDGNAAIEDAKKYFKLSTLRDCWAYRLAAAVSAEVGDFRLAVKHQRKALHMANQDPAVSPRFREEAESCLKEYESSVPHRLRN